MLRGKDGDWKAQITNEEVKYAVKEDDLCIPESENGGKVFIKSKNEVNQATTVEGDQTDHTNKKMQHRQFQRLIDRSKLNNRLLHRHAPTNFL